VRPPFFCVLRALDREPAAFGRLACRRVYGAFIDAQFRGDVVHLDPLRGIGARLPAGRQLLDGVADAVGQDLP
jgi:hypothetical protein